MSREISLPLHSSLPPQEVARLDEFNDETVTRISDPGRVVALREVAVESLTFRSIDNDPAMEHSQVADPAPRRPGAHFSRHGVAWRGDVCACAELRQATRYSIRPT